MVAKCIIFNLYNLYQNQFNVAQRNDPMKNNLTLNSLAPDISASVSYKELKMCRNL